MKKKTFLALSLSLAFATPIFAMSYNPALKDGINLTNKGTNWPGFGPNYEEMGTVNLPYSRIPSMVITRDGELVVMFDLRWQGANDQTRIDPGIAISSDGGYTWEKRTAWQMKDTWQGGGTAAGQTRRTMDATMLYNQYTDELFVMHGTWSAYNGQWYGKREEHWDKDIWSAQIHKSLDHGRNWAELTEFRRTENADVFAHTTKNGDPIIGFLGGVGTGIVTTDGTLVFPIQTAHKNGIAATIMWSEDNGNSWHMPETDQMVAPNQSSLENMVFEMDDKLILTGRGNGRWAYETTDMGKTWTQFDPVHGFHATTSAPAQGSSLYVTLPSGRQVLLVSKTDGDNGGPWDYSRADMSLWVLDAVNPDHKFKVTTFRPGKGNPLGAGYSSLAYKDGNLFVSYEDDGDISLKDLSDFIPVIEQKAEEWGLEDARPGLIAKYDLLSAAQHKNLLERALKNEEGIFIEAHLMNGKMGDLRKRLAEVQTQADQTDMLPSRLMAFKKLASTVDGILNQQTGSILTLEQLTALYNQLHMMPTTFINHAELAPYAEALRSVYRMNTRIAENFKDNAWVKYEGGNHERELSVGASLDLTDNAKLGLFATKSYETGKHSSVGFSYYQALENNVNLSAFLRQSGTEIFEGKLKTYDAYARLGKDFEMNKSFKVEPFVGVMAVYGKGTNLDLDVETKDYFDLVADVGVKFAFQWQDWANLSITPQLSLHTEDLEIRQVNKHSNLQAVPVARQQFNVQFAAEKVFANGLNVQADVNIGKAFNDENEHSFGVKVGYRW